MPDPVFSSSLGLQLVNIGQAPDDGQGDNLRDAMNKINSNTEILSANTLQTLTAVKNYYVSPTLGSNTNPGSTPSAPFQTIQAAVDKIYSTVITKDFSIVINLLAGTYSESVKVLGRPVASRTDQVDLTIKKDSSVTGLIPWTLDLSSKNYCISVGFNARVHVADISFSTTGTKSTTVRQSFIKAQAAYVSTGNIEYKQLGSTTLNLSNHIALDKSELEIKSPYSLIGTTYSHIYSIDNSKVSSTSSSNIAAASGAYTVSSFVEAYRSSKIDLPTNTYSITGNVIGNIFTKDRTSEVLIGSYPISFTIGVHLPYTVESSTSHLGTLTTQGGLSVNGPTTVNNSSNFTAPATFSTTNTTGNATFGSNITVSGTVTTANPPIDSNTNISATTSFVQTVVQEKILAGQSIATSQLYGIVKVNENSSDPVVYIKPAVDTLLSSKANLASPAFTGTPTAPTPTSGDNSTNVATTQFVKSITDNIQVIPSGVWFGYGGVVAPTGYLLCDGSYVSRDTYPNLFTALSTRYGTTTSTNFRLPDFRNKVAIGALAGVKELGTSGGAVNFKVTIAEANLPAHNHLLTDGGHSHVVVDGSHAHPISDPGHRHPILAQDFNGDGATDSLINKNTAVAGEDRGTFLSYLQQRCRQPHYRKW